MTLFSLTGEGSALMGYLHSSISLTAQKAGYHLGLSFRRKPESSLFKYLQNIWTPVFTGVTAFCETVRVETKSSKPYRNKYMSRKTKIKYRMPIAIRVTLVSCVIFF